MDDSLAAHKVVIDNTAALLLSTEHNAEFIAITEVAALIPLLQGRQTNINVALDIQLKPTAGITTHATHLRSRMAHIVIKYAHKGLPKARAAHNDDLVKLLSHEEPYIFKAATKDLALSNSRGIISAITLNGAIFTNILPAHITSMNNTVDAYEVAKTETPNAIDEKKDEGTAVLLVETKAAMAIIQDIYDYVYGEYIDTNKPLVDLLKSAMTVEIEGARHTGFNALFVNITKAEGDLGYLVQDAKLKIVERDITETSDILGKAGHSIMKPGTYHVQVTKTGFKPLEAIVTFKKGRTISLEVDMAPDNVETNGSIKLV